MSCMIFLVILNLLGCKSQSSQTYETNNEINVPTTLQTDSIAAVLLEQEEVLEKTIPAELKKEKEEIREEKKDNSMFRVEGCCSNEPPPALCCCEPVWIKYLEFIKTTDANMASIVRSEDPILNDCYKLIPSFKKKMDQLEMGEEE